MNLNLTEKCQGRLLAQKVKMIRQLDLQDRNINSYMNQMTMGRVSLQVMSAQTPQKTLIRLLTEMKRKVMKLKLLKTALEKKEKTKWKS